MSVPPPSTALRAALAGAALSSFLQGAAIAQGSAGSSGPVRIDWVSVQVVDADGPSEATRRLEADIRRSLGLYPGSHADRSEIDQAIDRLRRAPQVSQASGRLAFDANGETGLDVVVDRRPDAPRAPSWTDGLRLVDDGRQLLKLRLGLKGATAISANQWLGNGPTLTQFNPRGRYDAGPGPNLILDLAPSIGAAGALPLGSGTNAPYLYASVLYLGTASVGQDNNRNDARTTGQWEEAFVGLVGSGTTEAGLAWRANLSYGLQPYCIGNGMLVCQIASSGGDRGADFGWPRWSGEDFLKAQLRVNNTLVEGFRFSPNDFPTTNTVLAGINAEHDFGHGFNAGFTWLTAREGELKYFFPDGRSQVRDGLKVWHARAALRPQGRASGAIGKVEYARQTHRDFDMRASGGSAEAGWQFASPSWRPSVTYRYSSTTGDDPATPRYERWDLLYSGNDVDTWVQGQLMKNLHYNSNVRVQRLLVRATPDARWRLTGAVSSFRADTLNNIGGVISTLAGPDLGRELLLVAEHFASRQVYWRFTAASLWPGSGITGTLPDRVSKPWLVGIVQFNLSY